jgi:hypothetical protein
MSDFPFNTTELTAEKIAELKARHGRIAKVTSKSRDGFVVIRMPTLPEYQRATDKLHDSEASKRAAYETVGKDCTVFPEGAELVELLAKLPGLAYVAGDEALELSGLGKAQVEKLLPSSRRPSAPSSSPQGCCSMRSEEGKEGRGRRRARSWSRAFSCSRSTR